MSQIAKKPKDYSLLMTAGHLCCDLNQSMVPALLPFLVAERGIDYTAAAGLIFASSSLSSLVQPLLGILSDRNQRPWLMAVGILTTGIGIASIGFLSSYWGIFAMIMLAGLGSAVFHPEGGRMASCVAGEKKGRAISNFSVGGNIGYSIGPLVATGAISVFGLSGTAVALVPTAIIVTILIVFYKKLKQMSDDAKLETAQRVGDFNQKDDWNGFFRLCLSIFTRSIVGNGIATFVPLYWVFVLMQSQEAGSLMVTFISIASAITAFLGGRLGDRFGYRKVIQTSYVFVFPLIVLLLLVKNVVFATIIVMLIIITNSAGHSPAIVLGQSYLPRRVGLASGMTIGLAVSMGGMCSPLLGRIGDNYGLTTTFYIVAGISVIGFLMTLLIKKESKKEEVLVQ